MTSFTAAAAITTAPSAAIAAITASSVFFIPLSAPLGRIRFGLLRGTVHADPVECPGVAIPTQTVTSSGLASLRPEVDRDHDQNKRGDADNEKSDFHSCRIKQHTTQASRFAPPKGAV